ncbi:MAG: hypothetical protein Tsb0020_53600 [Haliangiales bacterium]
MLPGIMRPLAAQGIRVVQTSSGAGAGNNITVPLLNASIGNLVLFYFCTGIHPLSDGPLSSVTAGFTTIDWRFRSAMFNAKVVNALYARVIDGSDPSDIGVVGDGTDTAYAWVQLEIAGFGGDLGAGGAGDGISLAEDSENSGATSTTVPVPDQTLPTGEVPSGDAIFLGLSGAAPISQTPVGVRAFAPAYTSGQIEQPGAGFPGHGGVTAIAGWRAGGSSVTGQGHLLSGSAWWMSNGIVIKGAGA